ncbi:MAG: hypothetical protein H7338_23175 [Candidatus Sericytochromatia bacterium]|nr:hypothetical protein [Candidatus Sericytochromatia bacterium]
MITVCMVTIVGVEGTKDFPNRDTAMAEIKAKGWRIEYETQQEIVVRVPLPAPDKNAKPLKEHSVRAI